MTTDLVTIAIPVFERTDFFEEALNSALNQSVQCPILVMDNGSSHDRFKDICNQYPEKVEYHKNSTNIGMYPNWNLCFKNSRTPFVMLLGDDDILCPNYIEHFVLLKKQHPEIQVYYSDYSFLLWPQNELTKNPYVNLWGLNKMLEVKKQAVNTRLGFPSISSVIARELILEKPFEEKVHGSNDWFAIYHFDNDVMVYGDQVSLVKYRKHQKANTNDKTVQNLLNITQLLTLCDLSLDLNAGLSRKLLWLGSLHSFISKNDSFVTSFFSQGSCYKTVFETINTKHKFLYNISLAAYNIRGFLTHGRSGKN